MEFFKTNTKIKFMRQRKWTAIFSAILFVASLTSLLFNGLNLGLDFTGGTQLVVQYNRVINTGAARQSLAEHGFKEAVVVTYGTPRIIAVKVGQHKELTADQLKANIMSSLPSGGQLKQSQFIGAQIGKTLKTNGILAIVVSLIATMIYVALRFEYRFAVSAALALIHDPMLILGVFSFFHLEFNLIVLAALLTVIGYSLNDTIVVYDRVRENFRKVRKGTSSEIMDLSINQTLSRTIMTSGLTLLVVIALYFFGGEVVHGFALALIIGIIIGTYSSIYVAGSLAIAFGLDRRSLLVNTGDRVEDSLP